MERRVVLSSANDAATLAIEQHILRAAGMSDADVKAIEAVRQVSAAGAERLSLADTPYWASLPVSEARSLSPTVSATSLFSASLDAKAISRSLSAAPWDTTQPKRSSMPELLLPTPTGSVARFAMEQYDLISPEVRGKFPEIKAVRLYGLDDAAAVGSATLTPTGLSVFVSSPDGDWHINPVDARAGGSAHASYFNVHQFSKKPEGGHGGGCQCAACLGIEATLQNAVRSTADALINLGSTRRTFRFAFAATAEYTTYFGAAPAGYASILNKVAAVNVVFTRDFNVTFTVVSDTRTIYTNPATDPYTNNDVVAMLQQNQSVLNLAYGSTYGPSSGYHVGHVLGLNDSPSGVAAFGVVGSAFRAQGVTTGQPLSPDFNTTLFHELGHQLAASHTYNNADAAGRAAFSALEPGPGSTIMSYGGNDLGWTGNFVTHADTYFHHRSIDQVENYLNSIPIAGTSSSTGNEAPVANAGPQRAIPARTPFELTGHAYDTPGQGLTYTWEQYDLGDDVIIGGDVGNGPLFRSRPGTANPTRSFPELADVLANRVDPDEFLPTQSRTVDPLTFRLTVRDQLGGVSDDFIDLPVVDTGSAFATTSQNTAGTVWAAGSQQLINWNVAGTTGNGIDSPFVDIYLSYDGGVTFTLVDAGVSNDGFEPITVPVHALTTANARVKVKGAGNYFFDINNAPITINGISALGGLPSVAPQAEAPVYVNRTGLVQDNALAQMGIDPFIESLGETDTYRFSPTTTAFYNILAGADGSSVDTVLAVYDDLTGAPLAFNDNSPISTGTNSLIALTLEAGKLYRITIGARDSATFGDVSLLLSANATSPIVERLDLARNSDGSITGTFASPSESGFYGFVNGFKSADVLVNAPDATTVLTLYDQFGNLRAISGTGSLMNIDINASDVLRIGTSGYAGGGGEFTIQLTGLPFVNAQGATWILGPETVGDDLRVYRQLPGQAPQWMGGGSAIRIGRSTNGTVVLQNSARQVYLVGGSENGGFTGYQLARHVNAAANTTWFLGPEGAAGDFTVYRWKASEAPASTSGAASTFGLANDSSVLVRNAAGAIFIVNGSATGTFAGYQLVTDRLEVATSFGTYTVFLGPDGSGADRNVYYWTGSTIQSGNDVSSSGAAASRLALAQNGALLLRQSGGTVLAAASGNVTPFTARSGVLGPNDTTWFLGPDGNGTDLNIYRWPSTGGPVFTDGRAVQIGQADDGKVVVRNSSRDVFWINGSLSGSFTGFVRPPGVQAGGSVSWFLLDNGVSAGGNVAILRWPDSDVPSVVGYAARIAKVQDSTVVVQRVAGDIQAAIGSNTGSFSAFSLLPSVTAGDGADWFLSTEANATGSFIYRWAGTDSSPSFSQGAGSSLGVFPDGRVWTRNPQGDYFVRIGSNNSLGGPWQLLASSLNVTTTADELDPSSNALFGTGTSLREALAYATQLGGARTITFALGSDDVAVNLTQVAFDFSALRISTGSAITLEGPAGDAGVTLAIPPTVGMRHFFVSPNATLTLKNLTLTGGSAGSGGSIFVDSRGNLDISSSTLAGNSAAEGGAIFAQNDASVSLTNVTIAGNRAFSSASAILSAASSGAWTNVTIADNVSGAGGPALRLFVPVLLRNSIIARNVDVDGLPVGLGTGSAPFASGSSNNLVTPSSGSGLLNANGNLLSVPANSLRFGTLGDNGGPTRTIALLPGSPAINAGLAVAGVTVDQRGVSRSQGVRPDIGAYERVATNATLQNRSFDYETRQAVVFDFDLDASATFSRPSFTLSDRATNQVISPTVGSLQWNDTGTRAALVVTNLLADGDYRVTNGTWTFDFFVLAGDANRDRTVNFDDLLLLAANYNQSPRTFAQGDSNYDGTVNFDDLLMLASRYNGGLPAAALPSPPPLVVQAGGGEPDEDDDVMS